MDNGKIYYTKNNTLYIKNLTNETSQSFQLPFNSESYYVFDIKDNNYLFVSKIKPKIYIYNMNNLKELTLKEDLPYIDFIKFYKNGLIYYQKGDINYLKIIDLEGKLLKFINITGHPIKLIDDEIYIFNENTLIKMNLKTNKEEKYKIEGVVKDVIPKTNWVIIFDNDNLFFLNIVTNEKIYFPFFNQIFNYSDLVSTDGEFVLIKGYTLTSLRYLLKGKNIDLKGNDDITKLKKKIYKNPDNLELYEKLGDLYLEKKDYNNAFFFYQCKVINSFLLKRVDLNKRDESIRWFIRKRIDFIESENFNKGNFENYPFITDNLIIKYLNLINKKSLEDGKIYFKIGEFLKAS
ncbi:MAG: hypothetical protein H5U37_02525 [Caldisericia bacterium]|nr:hypothetical protein [Caldisericia bacterium]